MTTQSIRIDGVGVAIDGKAVLLRGPSGSGRSDLALRLIDEGAELVSDEQVELRREGDAILIVMPPVMPAHLVGRIEARGLGLVPVPHVAGPVPLAWVVDMAETREIDRMPPSEEATYLGLAVPLLRIDPAKPSATAKLRLAVRCGPGNILGRD